MITEIPTQSRHAGRMAGTVLCIILAAAAGAMILTAPVWSVDDQGLPEAGQTASPLSPSSPSSTATASSLEPTTRRRAQ